ncbi:MAG: adenylate/guanylate cyclase domain-containing protein [Anaerolineales bacterium]|nr:adenylate/guanylate cyclase domain-containing protein [Anaerolineales bacterium]
MALREQNSAVPPQKSRIILLIFLVFAVLELAYNFPDIATPLEKLELSARDTAVRLQGVRAPHEKIVIVDIDDQSLSWVGERWPWSRSRMAEIVTWLNEAGAEMIAYDIFLFDPSANPQEDQALADAFEAANSVVTVSQVIEIPYSTTHNIPEEIFLPFIEGYGITEVERDDDAVVRSVLAYKQIQENTLYNWSFEIVQAGLHISPPKNPSPNSVEFNAERVPLNQRGHLLINFAGPRQTYPTYSAAYLLEGDYNPDIFKDKIVLIGSSSETLQDIYPTPFSTTNLTPGVEIVANLVATMLTGDYLRLSPPWLTLLILLALALLARLVTNIPRPMIAVPVMGAGVILYLMIWQIVFSRTGMLLSIIAPILVFTLGVVIPTLEEGVNQEMEKRRVRGLFSRFISPEMVDQMLETRDIDSLNKRTNLTILFSDIRGFTTLSENMSPEELVSLLNPYLDVMTTIIHKHGGTVDKYEGDAIIAFFGEPIPHADHAVRAASAALEMHQALEKLNRTWQQNGVFSGRLKMGIGINTGEVFVGLLGSRQRINYTVIGDAANLAARLQDKTKELGVPILVSGETQSLIKHHFQTKFLDSALLKGKTEKVDIFQLVSE